VAFGKVDALEAQAGLSNADRYTRQYLRFNALCALASVLRTQDGSFQDPSRPRGRAGYPFPFDVYLTQRNAHGTCADHAQFLEKLIATAGKEEGVMKGVRSSQMLVIVAHLSWSPVDNSGHSTAIAEYSDSNGKPTGLFTPFDTNAAAKGATKKPDRIAMGPTTEAERLLFVMLNYQQVSDAPYAGRPQDQYFLHREEGEVYRKTLAAPNSHSGKAMMAAEQWTFANRLNTNMFDSRKVLETMGDLAREINR
jgi:hypothetical protein